MPDNLVETTAATGEAAPRAVDIPREHRVFVNRNLRLDKIEMVGFDMDYTLALYNQARIEELSMRATLDKLVTAKGYPEAIRGLAYDPTLAMRGLVVDRENGNIFKPDRYGFPGRARHGLATIERAKVAELYQRERMRLSNRRYAWIDSLFALPEAVLYAGLVDYFDRTTRPASPRTTPCGSTSASASTSRTATDRSRPSSARSCRRSSCATIRRWPRRCTSSARRASGCSCSPTRPGTTPAA